MTLKGKLKRVCTGEGDSGRLQSLRFLTKTEQGLG